MIRLSPFKIDLCKTCMSRYGCPFHKVQRGIMNWHPEWLPVVIRKHLGKLIENNVDGELMMFNWMSGIGTNCADEFDDNNNVKIKMEVLSEAALNDKLWPENKNEHPDKSV